MRKEEIEIPINHFAVGANLVIPENVRAVVIFSHGSGSSRFSPRNNYIVMCLTNTELPHFLPTFSQDKRI